MILFDVLLKKNQKTQKARTFLTKVLQKRPRIVKSINKGEISAQKVKQS